MSYRFYSYFIFVVVHISLIKQVINRSNQNVERKLSNNVIGVNFGLVFIRYGVSDNGHIKLIPNRVGDTETPILINFDRYGNILLGYFAKYFKNRTYYLHNLPKLIGRTFREIKVMPGFPFQYDIIDRYNKPYFNLQFDNGSVALTAEEILAHFFKDIKMNAQIFLNDNVSRIVLSIHDSFDDSQELGIKAAANKGGLEVIKTLTESAASIFSYELDITEEAKNILFINVGMQSMTLLVNIMENHNVERLGIKTDVLYGESVFHQVLEEYLKRNYDDLMGRTLEDVTILEEMREVVRKLVKRLNVFTSVEFSWRSLNVNIYAIVTITRAKFDELIHQHVVKLLDSVTELLVELELKRSDIAEVILLGNVFKIPKLVKDIRNYFYGLELRIEKYQNEVILEGSTMVSMLTEDHDVQPNIVLLDILSANMGVEIFNGFFHVIVPKLSPIPVKMSKNLTITFDNQSRINIKVLEGNRPSARANSFLGELNFDKVSSGLRSFVLFNMEFDVRRNGIIIFSATDLNANVKKSLLISRDYGKYTNRDVSSNLDERSIEKDRNLTEISEVRLPVESIVYEIKSHLTADSAILDPIKRSSIDYIILKQSVDEAVLWLEKFSTAEVKEMNELQLKFESTIKPILARAYGK